MDKHINKQLPIVLTAILLAVLLLFSSGCRGADRPARGVSPEVQTQIADQINLAVMADFEKLIAQNTKPYVLMDFIEANISKVTKEEGSKMLAVLEDAQKKYLEEYGQRLFGADMQKKMASYFSGLFDPAKINEIQEADLKLLLNEMIEGGYKIIQIEGSFAPIIDYEKMKQFGAFIDNRMRSYIGIQAQESEKPTVADGGLMISLETLAARITETENYLKQYPDAPGSDSLAKRNARHILFYMKGLDNTPIYQKGKLKEDVRESYEKVIAIKPQTIFGQIIASHLELLKKRGYQYTKENDQWIGGLNLQENYLKYIRQNRVDGLTGVQGQAQTSIQSPSITITDKTVMEPGIEMQYPQIQGIQDTSVQTAINKLLMDKAYEFIRKNDHLPEDERNNISYWGDYEIIYQTPRILSILYHDSSYYKGAAHPNDTLNALTISLETGEPYALKTLFKPGADYVSKIEGRIKKEIQKQQVPLLKEYEGMTPKQEFYLTEQGLVVYYQTYEYTPYAYGPLKFTIPYKEIKSLMAFDM